MSDNLTSALSDFSGYESSVTTYLTSDTQNIRLEHPSVVAHNLAYEEPPPGKVAGLDNFTPGYERSLTVQKQEGGLRVDVEYPGILAYKSSYKGYRVADEVQRRSEIGVSKSLARSPPGATKSPARSPERSPMPKRLKKEGENGDASAPHRPSTSTHVRADPPSPGKNPNRVEGGKRAAAQRTHEDFVEMGRKGGQARAEHLAVSKSEDDGYDSSSSSSVHRSTSSGDLPENKTADGKNPNRVEGGKRAAEKRGQVVHDREPEAVGHTDDVHRAADSGDREENKTADGKNPNRVEGGKRAAEKRGQVVHDHEAEVGHTDDSHRAADSGDREENRTADGKNPRRVEGGKRAAEKQGHEALSEHGKKGAHSSQSYKAAHGEEAGADEE